MTHIVMAGGPVGLARTQQVTGPVAPDRVTVDHYGRHEHFERTDQIANVEGHAAPVFQWTHTTAIAE